MVEQLSELTNMNVCAEYPFRSQVKEGATVYDNLYVYMLVENAYSPA